MSDIVEFPCERSKHGRELNSLRERIFLRDIENMKPFMETKACLFSYDTDDKEKLLDDIAVSVRITFDEIRALEHRIFNKLDYPEKEQKAIRCLLFEDDTCLDRAIPDDGLDPRELDMRLRIKTIKENLAGIFQALLMGSEHEVPLTE